MSNTRTRTSSTGWTTIGVGTDWTMLLLATGISLVAAFLLASPVGALIVTVSGARISFWEAALWCFVVLLLILVPVLVILSNRPAHVNLALGRVRVGWRTVGFDEVRHAYRTPGGASPSAFVVHLEVRRGLDARLPIRSDALPDLSIPELEILIALIERAPIVPKAGMPVRSPIGDEEGERSGNDLIADQVSDALAPFGRIAYTKSTLLAELRAVLSAENDAAPSGSAAMLPEPSDSSRAMSALTAGMGSGLGQVAGTSGREILPPESMPVLNPRRGFFGTAGSSYSFGQNAVEHWLWEQGAGLNEAKPRRGAVLRALGWAVLVAALVWPWVALVISFTGSFAGYWGDMGLVMWNLAIAVLLWHLPAWAGLLMLQAARVLRFRASRRRALDAMISGSTVPDPISDFFAPNFPGRSLAIGVYIYLIWLCVVLIGVGLMFVSLGFGQVDGPYEILSWQIPLGTTLSILSIACVVAALRWQRFMSGQLARARVEWLLLRRGA